MVSGKQWLRDAEEHVGQILLEHDWSTCTEPLEGIRDIFQYPLGEKIRGGRIVSLVKACARLWVTNREFTTLVKRDLMLFEFVAWALRRHMRAFQMTIGMRHHADLERWVAFRTTLNASRGASRAPAADGVEAVDGDDSAVDGEDEDSAANDFVANFLQKPPEFPPAIPPRMMPLKRNVPSHRLVPTPPAFPPTPPTPYGPMKRLPHFAKWHGGQALETSSESSRAHVDNIPLGTLPSVPLAQNPLVNESEVLLREQNAYLRGLLASGHRANPYD
jgi:hypothetical protein